ncbi:lysophospholipid acyltransferase family protein [Pacificibacter marinus]|uniref:lysophospholipid acyltransferase family protein n=1 Tax=Pacificibacter marinus TaxID=658057 RepID=UPI000A26FB8E|nr:lysophospholipid acyltransferase family protein [Pacificibacter marinus]
MHQERQVARDISYASSAETRSGRALIRVIENATGRLGLIKRVRGYGADLLAGHDIWQVMVDRYGLELDVVGGSLDAIPRTGPLVVVSNHPYGILDGLCLGHILAKTRGDFRILAHRVFKKAEDIDRVILPVSFEGTKEAVKLNLETRNAAVAYLNQGGCVGIFPGGTVSTAATPLGPALDPSWRAFTAKMIAKSEAQVVPIYFDGSNSRLFQLASHFHTTLRMGLLIREFRSKINAPVRVVIGDPIPEADLAPYRRDPKKMMDFLRARTYALSPTPLDDLGLGYEFEDKHKTTAQKTMRKGLKDRY